MTEAEFAALSTEEHEDILRKCLSAYYINRHNENAQALILTLGQMIAIISYGKISRKRLLELTREAELSFQETKESVETMFSQIIAIKNLH